MAIALCSVESVGCKPVVGIRELPRMCGHCPHHRHTLTHTQTHKQPTVSALLILQKVRKK